MKIVECGDPLVDYSPLPELVPGTSVFRYRRETLVRAPVAEMLVRAAQSLPSGFRLGVIEGWRAPHIQRRMYLGVWRIFQERHPDWSDVKLKRVVNRFTAPLDRRVPPPHSTGGAVDLFLCDAQGQRVDLTSPYGLHDPAGFPLGAPLLTDVARRHRAILAEALLTTGLTNYPSEWWHWTYGDQGWAYRGRHPHALYGPIMPDNWAPAPEDDNEEPFEFVE